MTENSRQADAIGIEVNQRMIDAGMHELRERSYGEDLSYILEVVFRAMAYESPLLGRSISQGSSG